MNIINNNVNFKGKEEVKYSIKKIAENAQKYEKKRELAYGPRPTLHYDEIRNIAGKIEGYTDMLIHDTTLDKSMTEINKDNSFIQIIKEKLTSEPKQFTTLAPKEVFKNWINNTAKNSDIKLPISMSEFLNKL